MHLIKQQLKLAKKPGLKKSKKQTTKAAAPPHTRDRSERVCTYTFSQGLLGEWERAWLHCQRLRPVSGAVLRVRGAGMEKKQVQCLQASGRDDDQLYGEEGCYDNVPWTRWPMDTW